MTIKSVFCDPGRSENDWRKMEYLVHNNSQLRKST